MIDNFTYIGNFLSKHGLNPTQSEFLVPELRKSGISVRVSSHCLMPHLRFMDMANAIFRVKKKSFVLIDLYSGARAFPAAYWLTCFCRFLHKPYGLVLHGGGLPDRIKSSEVQLNQMLKNAKCVVSPSRFLAEKFSGFCPIKVIPNGINVKEYSFRFRTINRPFFIYLRAFHQYYDPFTTIRAFSLVQKQYPAAKLVLAGPDEDGSLSKCRLLVEELSLNPNVTFLGKIPKADIPNLLAQNDIFINSSIKDNTPVSAIEAMATGMCVVATEVGGLPYLMKNEENALLVPPKDPFKMAEAMMRFLREPKLSENCSRNARQVSEAMDWSKVIPQWLELIRSVSSV